MVRKIIKNDFRNRSGQCVFGHFEHLQRNQKQLLRAPKSTRPLLSSRRSFPELLEEIGQKFFFGKNKPLHFALDAHLAKAQLGPPWPHTLRGCWCRGWVRRVWGRRAAKVFSPFTHIGVWWLSPPAGDSYSPSAHSSRSGTPRG